MGSRGGIGRYEQLLQAALSELASRGEVEWRGVWRDAPPGYLGPSQASRSAGGASVTAFVRAVARSARGWRPDIVCFTHVLTLPPWAHAATTWDHCTLYCWRAGVEVWTPSIGGSGCPCCGRSKSFPSVTSRGIRCSHSRAFSRARTTTLHLALEDHWRAKADDLLTHLTADPQAASACSLLSVCRSSSEKRATRGLTGTESDSKASPHYPRTSVHGGRRRGRSDYLQKVALQLNIRDHVIFAGALDHDALLTAYLESDVFVLPTRREGFGLVFLEAMAFRKPIVAMASAGTLDVVGPNREGILINGEGELADAIAMVIGDRALAMRLGDAGYRTIVGHFSFEAFVARFEALLVDAARTASIPFSPTVK